MAHNLAKCSYSTYFGASGYMFFSFDVVFCSCVCLNEFYLSTETKILTLTFLIS